MTMRVRTSIESGSTLFTLSGRIQSSQVPELKAMLDSQSSDVVLDMKDVRLVDRETVLFFASLEARGIHLRNCPPYIREWIDQETNALVWSEPEISGK